MSPASTRIYSKIDLKHAYHLVCIAKGDEPKTAFHTCYGSYKWQVMPFRLSNAPAAFQRFINEVLRDLMDVCMVGYLGNILIYLDSLEDPCSSGKCKLIYFFSTSVSLNEV